MGNFSTNSPIKLIVNFLFTSVSASFYGSSYIHVPLQDARSTTEIQFRFKTKRADSFLLLAAGRTDYCLLRLEFGKLKVRFCLQNNPPAVVWGFFFCYLFLEEGTNRKVFPSCRTNLGPKFLTGGKKKKKLKSFSLLTNKLRMDSFMLS